VEKRYDYITPDDYATAEKNGISVDVLNQRVRTYLWDVDRAITTPKKKLKCFKKTWAKWREIATENGIDREIFTNRVRSLAWSEEEAATTKKGVRSRGKWTEEELEIARNNGVDHNHMSVVNMRISKLGWTKEEALNTPKLTEIERQKRVAAGTKKYHKERGVNREFNEIV